jgi:hypothetical protein
MRARALVASERLSAKIAALQNLKSANVGSGSWLCENSSARATRRNLFDQLHL